MHESFQQHRDTAYLKLIVWYSFTYVFMQNHAPLIDFCNNV